MSSDEDNMGYTVFFKGASLKQIFTGAAGAYSNECLSKVADVVRHEAPDDQVAGIIGRPEAWNMMGQLTDSVKEKLMALPFVEKIETGEETRKRFKKRRTPAAVIKGWVQSAIYKN